MKFGTSSIFLFYQSIEAVTDDKRVLKHIMIDILNLRNGMEDNLLLIQQINLMIQKEGEEQKGFDDVIHAAQQHIDSVNTAYTLGVSWLKDETAFALRVVHGKIYKNNIVKCRIMVASLFVESKILAPFL